MLHRAHLPGSGEHDVSAPESRAVESELTFSSSQHSVLFTPPTYVLSYEPKQFVYYSTNEINRLIYDILTSLPLFLFKQTKVGFKFNIAKLHITKQLSSKNYNNLHHN